MRWSILRAYVKRLLSPAALERVLRLRDKRATQKRKQRRERALARFGEFDAAELTAVLRGAGIPVNSVVFAQCSFNDMDTFRGGPVALLKALLAVVGPEGTLIMPAYTANTWETPPRAFDVAKEPTYAGIVAELFRRKPGVLRSLHPRHSLCGYGPLAEALLAGHEACGRADGPGSPLDKLRRREDSFIVTLGVPFGVASFFHWIEDYEPERLPFPVHDAAPKRCVVVDIDGRKHEVLDWELRPEVSVGVSSGSVAKLLSSRAMTTFEHKGVRVCIYRVRQFSEELIALRDRGIIHYARPGSWRLPWRHPVPS